MTQVTARRTTLAEYSGAQYFGRAAEGRLAGHARRFPPTYKSTTTMRRTPLLLIAGAAAVLAASCSDTLAPARSAPANAATRSAESALPALARGATRGPSLTITTDPGSARAGVFTLRWSANSVACVGDPCVPTSGPVTVNVQYKSRGGLHWVDFSPHVEFRPESNVTLETSVYRGTVRALLRSGVAPDSPIWQSFNIRYAESIGDLGVIDEPTTIDFATGVLSRRVTHFSGYVVTSGASCDATSTDCGN